MKLHDGKAAAEVLTVSPWTIRAYIRDGKLRPIRIGKPVRFDEPELKSFIASAKGSALMHEQNQTEEQE